MGVTEAPVCSGNLAEKTRLITDKFNKKEEKEVPQISRGLATERARWLQEDAYKKGSEKREPNEPVSREKAAEKARLIADKYKKKEEKDVPQISRKLATERSQWLEDGAHKKETEKKESTEPVSRERAAEKAKQIADKFKQKEYVGFRKMHIRKSRTTKKKS